jgi:CheY-like chemotaxis protein
MNRTLRVLFIDDDADTRLLARELMVEANPAEGDVQIDWLDAADVPEAMARWGNEVLDVLLVDNRLGGVEGVEWVPPLRERWACPVWIVSGTPDPALGETAARNGAAGVLAKDDLIADGPRLRAALLRVSAARTGADNTR